MPHNIHTSIFYSQYYPESTPQHMDVLLEEVEQELHMVVEADVVGVKVAVEVVTLL